MRESVFVTGGSGYVGRCFLRRARPEGYASLRVLVRDPRSLPADLHAREDIEVVEGDLLRPEAWASGLEGCTAVVHLAAVTGKARRARYREVHVEGTANLLRAARRFEVDGFLHVSTIAVTFPDQTRYFYAQTKRRAEELVHASGLPYTILRPTMVFGPGAPVLEGLAKLAGALVMPVFGRGEVRVQPIAVGDVARLLSDLLAERRFRNETLSAGGPETLSIEELLVRIRRVRYGKGPRTIHLPLRFTRRTLCLLEPLLLPLLPLTAGQLATFANDGIAEERTVVPERRGSLGSLDDMLRVADADD